MIGQGVAAKRVRDWCDRAYPKKLDLQADHPFRPLYNNRCHMNAAATVRQGDAVAIVECVILSDESATVHYVNLGADLRVFDGTLGPLYAGADYRLIKVWRDFPTHDPGDQLTLRKREIVQAALPFGLWRLYNIHQIL